MRAGQGRRHRLLVRSYLAGCLSVTLVWLVSGWSDVCMAASPTTIGQPAITVGRGQFGIGLLQWEVDAGVTLERSDEPHWSWSPDADITEGGVPTFFVIPLWTFFLGFSILLAVRLGIGLRRSAGRCDACGYDLTGLKRADGVTCPECGARNSGS